MARSASIPEPVERFFQFSLLGLLASGYFALAGSGYVDLPILLITGAAIIMRTLLVAANRDFPLSERWVTGVTILYILFYPVDYYFLARDFLTATVHLVLFLAIVKILTARTGRDYFYVIVVAFLEILAASLLSSRLNYFFFLALFLLFSIATSASWEIRRTRHRSRHVVRRAMPAVSWRLFSLALATTLGALLITAGLFFVLPRTAGAAFEHLVPERYHITAFSNEVTIGEIGEVKKSNTVLMHVRIDGVDQMMDLKWRGAALAEFDGRRWFNRGRKDETLRVSHRLLQVATDEQRRLPGRRLDYEVQLKTFASDALFIAGRPEFIRINSRLVIRSREGAFRTGFRSASDVLRYGVYASLDDAPPVPGYRPEPLAEADRARYLQLPPMDPRVAPLARRLTTGVNGAGRQARALEHYLQSTYAYTLELPKTEPADPIANFLFDRRKGHCEYFASSMAVMLRAVGIPSRVATGFQSGIYNPISGWIIIRASDAHSWVEAWLPGSGWTTFDPTPPDPSLAQPSLFSRLGLFFDAADTFWQDWVLSYDLDRQLTLAARVGKSGRRFSFGWFGGAGDAWRNLRDTTTGWVKIQGPRLLGGIVLVLLLGLGLPRLRRWWRGREQARRLERGAAVASDATILYRRALRLLERHGMRKPSWITPSEFARQLQPASTAAAIARLTAAYNDLRFGDRREAASRLSGLLGELERQLRST